MINRWKRSEKFPLFITLAVGITLTILFYDKLANATEQNSINSLRGVVELNNANYSISLDNINSSIHNNKNTLFFNTANLSSNIGHSENPEIVTNGTCVYVVWLDDSAGSRDVYFKRSVDNGTTFGETINISKDVGGALNPKIVASKSTGALYIVWEYIPGNNGQVFFTRSTDNGATFEKPVIIGNNTGLNGFPQIALSEDDVKVYVVWHDTVNGVLLRSSNDNGDTFEDPVSLSQEDTEALNPQIHISSNMVYVGWQSNPQDRNGEILFTRSTDNGATFEKPKPISLTMESEGVNQTNLNNTEQKSDSNEENYPNLSFNPSFISVPGNKEVYVVWYNGVNTLFRGHYYLLIDVFFTRSTDNGTTFEKPISLTNHSVWPKSTDNKGKFEKPVSLSGYSGWQPNLEIGASEHNYVYVAWQSNPQDRNGEIVFTRSTDNGATFEKPITISDRNGSSVNPQIAISKNNYVYVAWQSNPQDRNGEIVFTRSTDNGATFEKPITISDRNGSSVNPQIAISKNDTIYLIWTNNATGNEETIILHGDPKSKHIRYSNSTFDDGNYPNNSSMHLQTKNPKKFALIERTFTDAAYDNSFYLFYNTKRDTTTNVTKYTNLLSNKVTKQYSILPEFEVLANHLKWLTPQSTITLLTDADVHDTSSLFMSNGTITYDAVILGHNEYVTQLEYSNIRQFVANGGILILLDGNVFYGEVKYDKETQSITLVKGHSWEFDGTFASNSVAERWANETTEWVGSNYCECWGVDNIRFANNPFGVRHNEEQYITNPNAKIILDYQAYDVGDSSFLPGDFKIATYELDYKKGKVITLGLYTDDLLFFNDKFRQFFDSLLYYYVFSDLN